MFMSLCLSIFISFYYVFFSVWVCNGSTKTYAISLNTEQQSSKAVSHMSAGGSALFCGTVNIPEMSSLKYGLSE